MSFCLMSGLVGLPLAWGFLEGMDSKYKVQKRLVKWMKYPFNYVLILSDYCNGYTNLTEPWRNRAFMSPTILGFPTNDLKLLNQWWRFTGIGGNRVITSCIGNNLGGTENVLYIPITYSTNESLGKEIVNAYSGILNPCMEVTATVRVAYCPGGFYIYKPLTHPHTNMGYVTCEWHLL